ncbi:MAG: hypothetical protein M3Q69_02680 [Acidobacteriota bacterium]|nr:hypothetical protein [Acidobacteriota bacterium]
MRTASIIVVTLLLASAARAAPCSLSPAVLAPLRHPTAATDGEWKESRKALYRLMTDAACAKGPADASSRAVLFDLLEAEMTLDYKQLFKEWERRDGKPLSEGAAEGPLVLQRDLLAYIDRIVTPRDLPYRDVILQYANGTAIARLGREVRLDVKKQAGTSPKFLHGVARRSSQEEAFRAIGFWLDPADTTLTPAEKREFAFSIAGALPPDGTVLLGPHEREVTTIVQALGKSNVPEIEEKLRAWRHAFENRNGAGHSLARITQEAADQVRARARKSS